MEAKTTAISGQKVLVTGGAGFMPSHLVDHLVELGNDVVVLDDFSKGLEENLAQHANNPRVTIVRGSVLDQEAVNAATRGIDVVFHCAVKGLRESITEPIAVHEVNTTGTLRLLDAARAEGTTVKKFIYISSSEALGSAVYVPMDEEHPYKPMTPYAASKAAGDLYTMAYHRTYGIPVMIVRPFNMYGPRSSYAGVHGEVIPRFVMMAMAGRPLTIVGDGTQSRDFMYVVDAVHGIVRAAAEDSLIGDTVHIATGRETSIREIANVVLELTQSPQREIVSIDARPGDVHRHHSAVDKAKRVLGFEAQYSIRDGIAAYIAWVKEQQFDVEKIVAEMSHENWKTT